MSNMLARYCAVVFSIMISAEKHRFTDLRLDKSLRQTGAFGCNPQ